MKSLNSIQRSLCLLILATSAIATSVSAAVGVTEPTRRIGDFTLLDHQGKSHQLSWYGDHKAVVILAHAVGDGFGREQVAALVKIAQASDRLGRSNDAVFFLLDSTANGQREDIASAAIDTGVALPVLLDEAQLVAESLGLQNIGDAVVIDPNDMRVVFQGPATALQPALNALVAGLPYAGPTQVAATGSVIEFVARSAHQTNGVSYAKDIVPILENHCVSCHHDGAIGSWSMSNHTLIRGWSPMMREVVMTRRMPPGQIDPHVGLPIDGVAGLSLAEQQKLVHWIDAGSPQDGAEDPLTKLTFNDPKFSLGEPDLVFKVAAQNIPATGVVDYRYVPVELNLDRDVWVQAMEFVPGDRQVLHHVIAYLQSPADKTARKRDDDGTRGENVGGFAPGRQPDHFGAEAGRLIPKGSNLLLQMHYTTSGKASVDETEIGLFLHDDPPKYVMGGGVAGQRRFLIPPHAKEHKLVGEQLIERDAYLYSMTPHMHFRGKYMSYTAQFPDGSSTLLLSVPKYDFNWQFSYELEQPLFLPAGTKLVAHGAMDNSERNRHNPDPSKPVHFGLQTKHEMFFGFTTLRYIGDTPESVRGTAAAGGGR